MKTGVADSAMMQLEVPQISATRRRCVASFSPSLSSVAPITPSPPACASMAEAATGTPAGSPSSPAAASDRPAPTLLPIGSISVPIRRYPSSTRSDRPMARK